MTNWPFLRGLAKISKISMSPPTACLVGNGEVLCVLGETVRAKINKKEMLR